MTGNDTLDQLLAETQPDSVSNLDWPAISEVLTKESIELSDLVAVSWCSFKVANIEANFGEPGLAMVHPAGVVVSAGKRKLLGKAVKCDVISFSSCRDYGPVEHTDERGYGRYCIEFAGAGGILLGRLEWNWRAKRFRDSRAEIMAVAEERDRILSVVNGLLATSPQGNY